jgi:hypothetical protein
MKRPLGVPHTKECIMKFILLFKSNPGNENGAPPPEGLFAAMDAYNKQMADAGVFVSATGYDATRSGAIVREEGGKQSVTKGPFGNPHEIVAGTTTIEVKDLDEAIAWAKKAPNIGGRGARHEIEIRQAFE